MPPAHATGDAGYWNVAVERRARALGTEAWVASARVRHGQAPLASRASEPPAELDARARMRFRLDSAPGRALYARRKAVVEPVNGQIKHARRFRQFSLRGLAAVEAEWTGCACATILKLFRRRHSDPSAA